MHESLLTNRCSGATNRLPQVRNDLAHPSNGILLGMLRRVCVIGCGLRRYVSGCPKTQILFFTQEVPAYLFFSTNPAQPRAPPA